MSLPEELIEDTSYKLWPLGLLHATLDVDEKFGERCLHLTVWSRVKLTVSFPKHV